MELIRRAKDGRAGFDSGLTAEEVDELLDYCVVAMNVTETTPATTPHICGDPNSPCDTSCVEITKKNTQTR